MDLSFISRILYVYWMFEFPDSVEFRIFLECAGSVQKSSPIRQPITLLNSCFRFAAREQIR